MTLSIDQFGDYFHALYELAPFPWQTRLAKQVATKGWPDCIDLPTASGKTAAIDVAVFVLALQAGLDQSKRTVGRRIFFTVNRRVIVDEAFGRAVDLAEKLQKAKSGVLREVADGLRLLNESPDAPPLDIAQLRGGVYRDRAWARSLTQPMVVCTTADQLGSRLLFRGYGVSPSSAPIQAALCACDSLILLDEAHVTRAFSQTLTLLANYHQIRTSSEIAIPGLHFVQMTATPAGEVRERFVLEDADRSNQYLKPRLGAKKSASLVSLDKKQSLPAKIVELACNSLSDSRKAIGVIVNRVQTARDVVNGIRDRLLKDKLNADVHLVIGRMRPLDRDDLQAELRKILGPERPTLLDKPVFVVATQCLEVGADYDFDALITECASIDALRQRFGRLNRRGRDIEVCAVVVVNNEALKGDDPIYGDAIKETWAWLQSQQGDAKAVDFGITSFDTIWEATPKDQRSVMLAPSPDAAVLLPVHLDALCQTNPQPVPAPEVSYFIHGPSRDNAEISVCWRADLGDDDSFWPDIVRLIPPSVGECMTVPLLELRIWLSGSKDKTDRDADIPVLANDEEAGSRILGADERKVLIWRGTNDVRVAIDPRDIRPGDTLVLPEKNSNWNNLGHIPDCEPSANVQSGVDIAVRAARESKHRVIVRVHPAFPENESLRLLSDNELRHALVGRKLIPETWAKSPVARFERHPYPKAMADDAPAVADEIIIFKRPLPMLRGMTSANGEEDDGADSLSERGVFVPLKTHTAHVCDALGNALAALASDVPSETLQAAAKLHDIGKADIRFQAMLAGVTPYEAMLRPTCSAKGDRVSRTKAEGEALLAKACYPRGFRHEMLSVELAEHLNLETEAPCRSLMLHLIASHHGYARPFAPVCFDDATNDELRSVSIFGKELSGVIRKAWTPSHRLDSGVAERFWELTRKHGWWGLAWLESILRLADQQASASEQ